MPFNIVRNNITQMQVDAIVNSANPLPIIGEGVDSQIHMASGEKLLQERKRIGKIEVGEVIQTSAYNLPSKFVFHTVGPIWKDGKDHEQEKLKNCYLNCLELAIKNQCESIAFPLISTGSYGFPKDLALEIAIQTISSFLLKHDLQVYLVVFDKTSYQLSEKLFNDVQSYIDERYVDIHFKKFFANANRRIEEDYCEVKCESALPIEEIIKNVESTFSENMMDIIIEKDYLEKDVYKRANIDRKLFSKIRNNKYYQPSKITAIALAIGLQLNLDEMKDFIGKAGYALTHSSKFDIIIEYFISNQNYNIFEINEVLFMFDQPVIGG